MLLVATVLNRQQQRDRRQRQQAAPQQENHHHQQTNRQIGSSTGSSRARVYLLLLLLGVLFMFSYCGSLFSCALFFSRSPLSVVRRRRFSPTVGRPRRSVAVVRGRNRHQQTAAAKPACTAVVAVMRTFFSCWCGCLRFFRARLDCFSAFAAVGGAPTAAVAPVGHPRSFAAAERR